MLQLKKSNHIYDQTNKLSFLLGARSNCIFPYHRQVALPRCRCVGAFIPHGGDAEVEDGVEASSPSSSRDYPSKLKLHHSGAQMAKGLPEVYSIPPYRTVRQGHFPLCAT